MGAPRIRFKQDTSPQVAVERRAAARYVVEVPVCFRAPGVKGINYGHTVNLSREGIFVTDESPPAIGTKLDMEIEGPEGAFHVTVEVMRHGGVGEHMGMGLKLRQVSSEAMRRIQDLLSDAERW